MMLARFLTGILLDYIWAPHLTIALFMAPAIGLLVLALGDAGQVSVLVAILLGIGFGCELNVLGYMVSRAFGRRHYAQLLGIAFAFFSIASGAGPLMLTIMQRWFGGRNALLGAAGMILVATSLLLLLRRRDFPYASHTAVAKTRSD